MGIIVIKFLQDSAVTYTVVGGLTIRPVVQFCIVIYVPKIMRTGWQ